MTLELRLAQDPLRPGWSCVDVPKKLPYVMSHQCAKKNEYRDVEGVFHLKSETCGNFLDTVAHLRATQKLIQKPILCTHLINPLCIGVLLPGFKTYIIYL